MERDDYLKGIENKYGFDNINIYLEKEPGGSSSKEADSVDRTFRKRYPVIG